MHTYTHPSIHPSNWLVFSCSNPKASWRQASPSCFPGDHTMKVYEPPTAEELTPGSSPFRARVALLKQRLGERLVAVPEGLEMIKSLG